MGHGGGGAGSIAGSGQGIWPGSSGRPADRAYVVDGVRFDGYQRGVLQDAKGPGYENFVDAEGGFQDWFLEGQEELVEQARRQSRAAKGIPVEWHVAEARALGALRLLFEDAGMRGITLIHTPVRP